LLTDFLLDRAPTVARTHPSAATEFLDWISEGHPEELPASKFPSVTKRLNAALLANARHQVPRDADSLEDTIRFVSRTLSDLRILLAANPCRWVLPKRKGHISLGHVERADNPAEIRGSPSARIPVRPGAGSSRKAPRPS
jgi:hypothetical protein